MSQRESPQTQIGGGMRNGSQHVLNGVDALVNEDLGHLFFAVFAARCSDVFLETLVLVVAGNDWLVLCLCDNHKKRVKTCNGKPKTCNQLTAALLRACIMWYGLANSIHGMHSSAKMTNMRWMVN